MDKLPDNWITTGLIDFEYKSYELLGYLQHVNKKFDQTMLYPEITNVIKQYNDLVQLKKNKEQTWNKFPKRITSLDLETIDFNYDSTLSEHNQLKEIDSIIEFAIPKLFGTYQIGNEIHSALDDKIEVTPIGLIPLDLKYGYLFLTNGPKPYTDIYEYQLFEIHHSYDNLKALKTNYLYTTKLSLKKTYEYLKLELIHKRKVDRPVASYLIETKELIPYRESFSPLAKRKLMKLIS